ncbi:Dynamitin-domain-containing protein [Phialemonium atrogriseum]|uniref:Dynamitin-domain-containing protein n=1 Tax=Phialemonium atrogriseum TaxID=1093897 RepID=A0AAJ0FIV9_9PEZI|nr:Dynamitin-domain-containing protein [Phialemonium atrogriseum]KAK1769991.1 Dynamitin-domain-containing protein [Phialemonium atrogriseum]
MALNRKYAALPDLDSAPDIYETPELTDDNSTLPATTVRSPSDNEFDDEDDGAGISRTRLRIDQARSRFMPSNVDARDVDFSDRVNGKRKSYRASSRRQRILEDGTEEFGELTDEEDGESLARKLARLKREVEEAKEEYSRQQATKADAAATADNHEGEIASLSQALEEISQLSASSVPGIRSRSAGTTGYPTVGTAGQSQHPSAIGDIATYTVTYAPTYEETHALAKAADFDRRLFLLEKALGIGSSALPGLDTNGLPRAVLPTLDTLQKQISTLSEASTSSLDSISRRVRTLAQEADALEKSRRNAQAAQEALASTAVAGEADGSAAAAAALAAAPPADSDQAAKISALYGTLPTIESLAPLLPPLLDRLRSLRAIHADAAAAAETLGRVERTQADMAGDIKQWRDALERVEGAVKEGETAMTGNMSVVEGWVKELEERMAKLA